MPPKRQRSKDAPGGRHLSRQVGSQNPSMRQWKFLDLANKRASSRPCPPKTNTHWSCANESGPGEIIRPDLLPAFLTAIGLLLLWKAVSLFSYDLFALRRSSFCPHLVDLQQSVGVSDHRHKHSTSSRRYDAIHAHRRGRRLIMGCAARGKFSWTADHGAADLSVDLLGVPLSALVRHLRDRAIFTVVLIVFPYVTIECLGRHEGDGQRAHRTWRRFSAPSDRCCCASLIRN